MSLPEASLENIELGLRNVGIHNDERESRNSKDYLSNGKGMCRDLKEEDVEEERDEEEEEDDDDDIEADILRQSGYATIKKPCHQPIAIKKKAVVEEEEEEEEDDEDEDEDDIDADILRQRGYATVKKLWNQPMPVKPVKDDDEEEEDDDDNITGYLQKQSGYGNEEDEDEEEDDITTDILKQSGYGSMKKPLHLPTPKTAAPVKLVSALRGNREKEGIPTKNLSVTWSPEVYDPNPSAETFVRIKKPRLKTDSKKIQEFKKNGKPIGKDKGKASKGGRGGGGGGAGSSKDKKSKYSNNSRRSYGSFDNDD